MVMGLCLLVYSLGHRALRQSLKRGSQTIQNQLGKPTATPTLGWVFQCFMSIHLGATLLVRRGVELRQLLEEVEG